MCRNRCDRLSFIAWAAAVWIAVPGVFGASGTQQVTLRLKTGDQISGTVISEDASRIILSNRWIAELEIPINEVIQRELAVTPRSALSSEEPVAVFADTNLIVIGPAAPLRPPVKFWSGDALIGLNLQFGARDQHLYHGRFRLNYDRPYEDDPKLFFRNTSFYSAEYGRTEGQLSANRMETSNKTGWDLGKRWYVYSLVGAGYDTVRKIDAQYEAGPGAGYHLVARSNLVANVEAGFNFQAQFRSDSDDRRDFFYRIAQDITWKPTSRTTFTEKLELFPRVNLDELRFRFEATLGYEIWRNLSLNVTVLDLFDTQPASSVSQNELQIRSGLGLKF